MNVSSTTNKPTLKITFEHTARGLICRDPLAKNAMRSKVVSHLGFIRFAYELLLVNLSLVSIVDSIANNRLSILLCQ